MSSHDSGLTVYGRSPDAARKMLAVGLAWETLLVGASLAAATAFLPAGLLLALHAAGIAAVAGGITGLRGTRLFHRLELAFQPDPIALGASVQVRLECLPARPLRLDRLAIHLRCHERAVLREASRELFYVKKVFERTALVADMTRVEAGEPLVFEAKLRMPVDRCAAFASDNFAVEWSLAVEVVAERLPAATASWPARVIPVVKK